MGHAKKQGQKPHPLSNQTPKGAPPNSRAWPKRRLRRRMFIGIALTDSMGCSSPVTESTRHGCIESRVSQAPSWSSHWRDDDRQINLLRQSSETRSRLRRRRPPAPAPAPILRLQMEPQFMYLVLQPVWPETAAAHMLVARKQMDRPVLELVSVHPGDLTVQSLADFFVGKRAAEEARHLNIAPKTAR